VKRDGACYPAERKLQRFFAMKFLRLLVKTAAAQAIGTDGCWLLTIVVTTEDKTRYRRGVTFYNEQLMSLLGFTRWHKLDAVRTAAIEHGWLHYNPPPKGTRGRPGIYWVTLPSYAVDLPDDFLDEGEPSTPPSTESVDSQDQPSTESVDTPVDRCVDRCVEPSIPSLSLSPFLSQACDGPKNGKPKKPRTEYPEEFQQFWLAYPAREGRRNGKSKSFSLWKKITAADRPAVQAAAENFSRSKLARDGMARDPERFLANDWWRDWVETPAATQAASIYKDLQ
jgi:hypothetical protein